MRTLLALLAVAALIVATQFQPITSAADIAPNAEPNRFAGKILMVFIAGRTESPLYLENAAIEEIADVFVISGKVPELGGDENWTRGADAFAPLNHVESILSFSPEKFKEQVSGAGAQPDKNKL